MSEWGEYLSPHAYAGTRLEQAIGGDLLESLRPLVTCPECEGFGSIVPPGAEYIPCSVCHGTGKVKDPSVGPEEVARRVMRLVELCAFEGPPTLVAHHINEVLAGLSIPSEEPS